MTLSDCLACSGCITSAETVLLQAQSAEEFKTNCRAAAASNGARAVVVTVSPQSRVSLAHAAGLNPLDAAERLTGFFKAAGAARVFDSSAGRDFALLESCEEFVTRYRARRGMVPTTGMVPNSGVPTSGVPTSGVPPSSDAVAPLPVLTSACPGWVCYAEKTHGPATLRHVSAVKSPQAIMGTIVKRRVAAALGLPPSAVYHATVMPCFDKKLEASRDDFRDEHGVPDVDCVLTTGEVAEMLAEAAGHGDANGDPAKVRAGAAALASVAPAPLDGWLACAGGSRDDRGNAGWLWGSSVAGGGGGSGGYLDVVFRHAARELFGVEVTGPLEYKIPRARNPDLREVTLEVDGRVALRFAAAYGFRNIQNVVRKLKTPGAVAGSGSASGPGGYDFVEIMACPGGCLNGGGQLPPPPAYEPGFRLPSDQPIPATLGGMSAKELLDELDAAYHDGRVGAQGAGMVVGRRAIDNPEVAAAYREWIGDGVGSARAAAVLRTRYHDRGAEAAAAAGGTAAAAAQLKITSDW